MSRSVKILNILSPKQRIKSVFLLVLMVVGTFLEVLGIGLVLPVISIIVNPEQLKEYAHYLFFLDDPLQAIEGENFVVWTLLVLLTAYAAKGLFLLYLSWFQTKYAFDIQSSISYRLFILYLQKDWSFHINTNSSKVIRNIVGEVSTLVSNYVLPMLTLLIEVMVLLGVGILLLIVEPLGLILTVSFLGSSLAAFNYFTKPALITWGKKLQVSEKDRILHIQQSLGCFKELKLMSDTTFFEERYAKSNLDSALYLQKNTFLQAVPRIFIELIAIIGVLILAINTISNDNSEVVPLLGLFAAAAFRIMPSATRMITSLQYIQNSKAVLDNLHKELNSASEKIKPILRHDFRLNESININNISFSHDQGKSLALKNIEFEVKQGTCVGIIGESGSGKSTLIDLVLGLHFSSKGHILVDGVDITQNLREWQSGIGYIPQKIYLLDDTIRNNVALGIREEHICDNRVWEVLEKAQLKDFIRNSSNGLDTIVGEYGAKFSGGQLQRIGIARALYRDPDILILDEATSALDSETEKEIISTFSKLKLEKTLLIVTHRFDTLKICDKIIHLKNGSIEKVSTFSELVSG